MISKPYLIAARRLYAACSGFGAAIQRYILSLSGSSYMELSEPVTLAMGDTVSIQGVTATTGVSQTLFGSDGASKLLLEIDAAGLLQLTNCTATINGVAVADGASISADLTDVNTFEVTATGACSISRIGQNGSGSSFWIGNTLDLKINGVEWDIDSGSILYQLPVGGSLGGDVVVNGTFDTDLSGWEASTNWVWASPGVAQHQTGATNSLVDNVLTVGEYYICSFTVTGRTAGNIRQRAGNGISGTYQSSNGVYTEILQCTGNTEYLITPSSDFDGSVDNVSIKPVPNALIMRGVVADDWEEFERTYSPDAWTALDGSPILEIA